MHQTHLDEIIFWFLFIYLYHCFFTYRQLPYSLITMSTTAGLSVQIWSHDNDGEQMPPTPERAQQPLK